MGKSSNKNDTCNGSAGTKQVTLKALLGEALGYGPQLSEHMILGACLIPNSKISKDEMWDDDKAKKSGEKLNAAMTSDDSSKIYDEYGPILLNQFKTRDLVQFGTFDAALDEFYSKIEIQHAEQQQKSREGSAMQKLNKIRLDQENRVHAFKREVEHSIRMAQLIEYNLEDVDTAILAARVALAKGLSWEDLARMVKEEKKSGNPGAGLIDKLHLEQNSITLLLSNNLDEMDDDEKTQPVDK
ncbi:Ribosome quality control complex subunit NEMF-like protein, partial [Drosera capensis]